jgi:N-methylhydantoinase A
VDLAETAVAGLARALGEHPLRMAAGVVRLAVLQMASAVRMVSIERGRDPRDFTMVAYGGAGPLHAVAIARELGIKTVIIPRHPGHFSAHGMLYAALRYDLVQTLAQPLESLHGEVIEGHFRALEQQGEGQIRATGIAVEGIGSARYMDMRYQRQEHTITVRLPSRLAGHDIHGEIARLFEESYRLRYGHVSKGAGIDVVNLRVVMDGRTPKPPWRKHEGRAGQPVPSRREVFFEDDFVECAVWQRDTLPPGFRVSGPAVIEEEASTVILMPGDELQVDQWGNLRIEVGK